MSKGSRNRTTDWKAYRKSMDRIARNKKQKPDLVLSGTAVCTSEGFNTWSIGGENVVSAMDDADGFSGPVRVELKCGKKTQTHEGRLSLSYAYGWSSWTVEECDGVEVGDVDLLDILAGMEGKEVTLRMWWLEKVKP
jgi:hypothetical protein